MPINYAEIRKHKWAPEGGPPDWPTGVRPISMDGLTLIGIGPDNRLYIDGQQPAAVAPNITASPYSASFMAISSCFLSPV
jgi:hypothetical protein